jgi:hypothetical protein
MSADRRLRARQAAFRAVLELPGADALRVTADLAAHFGGGLALEDPDRRTMQRRAEVLTVMEQVADHLGLTDRATKVSEFDEACRKLGLPWDHSKVQRAWVLFRNAQSVFMGEKVVPSAARRRAARETGGIPVRQQDPVRGLQLWLEEEPPEPLHPDDYDAFAREYNHHRPQDEARILTRAGIRSVLYCSWEQMVAVARGEQSAEALIGRSLDDLIDPEANPLQLVSRPDGAAVLGVYNALIGKRIKRGAMPRPAVDLEGYEFWLREDIERYLEDGTVVQRDPADYAYVLGRNQVAELLGRRPEAVRKPDIEAGRVPRPAGRTSRRLYWYREDVESFLRKR